MDDFGEELSREREDGLSLDEILAEMKLNPGGEGSPDGGAMPNFDPQDFDFDFDEAAAADESAYIDRDVSFLSDDASYLDYDALSADFDEVYSAGGGASREDDNKLAENFAVLPEDDGLAKNFAVVPEEDDRLSDSFEVAPENYGRRARSASLDEIFEAVDSAQSAESPERDYDSLFLNLYDMRSGDDAGKAPEYAEGAETLQNDAAPKAAEPEESAGGKRQSRLGAMAAEARRHISGIRGSLFARSGAESAAPGPEEGEEDIPEDDGSGFDVYAAQSAEPEADFTAAEPEPVSAAEPQEPEQEPEPEHDEYDFDAIYREYSAMHTDADDAPPDSYEQAVELSGDGEDADAALSNEAAREPATKDDDIEIDSRFNLSGKRDVQGMVFGDKAVDLSADEDYTPAKQHGESMYHWVAEDEDAEPEDDGRKRRKSKRKQRAEAREKLLAEQKAAGEAAGSDAETEAGSGFTDDDAGSAEYAEDFDRGSADEEDDKAEGEDYFPPTFRQYLSSLAASVFLRVRGTAEGGSVYTMNDSDEELGAEVAPLAASRYYGSFIRGQKFRLRISFALLLILCYISIGLPVPGMLKYQPTAAAACCALQFAIMLLLLDVVTNAVLNIFRLRIGADSLSVFACLITALDALIVALSDSAAQHMPLCALSSLSLFGAALASSWSTRGMRKAVRVPAIGKRFYSVTGEIKFKDKQLTLLKSLCSAKGFVRRAEEAPPDETAFNKAAPFIFIFDFILAVIIAGVHSRFSSFIYIFSAVLAPSVPFMALAAFALPFFIGSSRIFKSGAAIAGWSGLCDIGVSRSLIVTDRDLFPEGTVTIESVRIFANESAEKVIAYAGTLVCASGSCAAASFAKLMERNSCAMQSVENFEYLPGGGMRGLIDGHSVLCGSTDLMRLMNVRIPYRLTGKTSVLLAIDGTLYGIFTMNYKALPQVRKSLVELVRSTRHPVFAIRDFNVNPEMLHNTFDIATDGYDFPPYVERYGLSEPARTGAGGGKIAAILCNEGLGPLTDVADTGRKMYLITRLNVLLALLSSVICALIVFFRLLIVGSATPGYLLLLMLAWALPVFISSLFVLK